VLSLQEEAALLRAYTAQQRAEYLHEVWCNPERGPAEAHALQRAIAEALADSSNGRLSTVGQNQALKSGTR
jgi:hypothetical protein